MKKIITLFLIICMSVCLIFGCDLDTTQTGSQSGENSNNTGESSVFEIPGTLTTDYFDLTIVSAEVCDTVTLDSGVEFDVKPDEGKQILVLSIDAKNTSDEIRNLGTFLAYVDDVTVMPNNVLGKLGDRILFSGAVDSGKTMCAYIMFQVPTYWENFEMSYVDSLNGSVSKSIKICKSDIT